MKPTIWAICLSASAFCISGLHREEGHTVREGSHQPHAEPGEASIQDKKDIGGTPAQSTGSKTQDRTWDV
jgi:hypothetical protein